MSKLDLLLKDFYQGKSLPQEQLDAIKQAPIENTNQDVPKKHSRRSDDSTPEFHQQHQRFSWLQQSAIAIALMLSLLGMTNHYLSTKHQKHQVIDEIVLNHHKPFQADVTNSNFTTVGKKLSGANFDVNVPEHIQKQFHLLGARYCSIANQLAIHLKLLDKHTDKESSLFITPTATKFKNIENDTELAKQHEAHYWSHKSLFYALLSEDTL